MTAVISVGCSGDDAGSVLDVGPRHRTSPQLRSFDSCSELHTALRAALTEEMRITLLRATDDYYYRGVGGGDVLAGAESDASAAPSDDGGRQEGVDFSGTNNQEQGVDEADFVKTDGYHIYLINGNRLEIFGVPTIGDLVAESTTQLEGRPVQMLMSQDQVVVFSNINPWSVPRDHPLFALIGADSRDGWYYRSSYLTKLTVIDVADRTAPTIERELYIEGWYHTGRKVDSTVRMLSYSWMDIPGLLYWPQLPDLYWQLDYDDPQRRDILYAAIIQGIRHNEKVIAATQLSDFIPSIFERTGPDTFVQHGFTDEQCKDFAAAGDALSRGVTSIMSLDLLGETFGYDADHVVTNWSTVYASLDTLVIAEPAFDWWWYWGWDAEDADRRETLNIHRFDISTAGQTHYTGSGRVEGRIRDQFALSEHEDTIRVATTTNQWWWWWQSTRDEIENHVFVLSGDEQLDVIGHLGGIAMGETIWSSRFVADQAFLVTFRQVDPLWTIDLSDPTAPRIVGELEVPGVSTYIHPMADAHLLTIGYAGDENGLDWNVQVSLFDVSDFAAPALDDALTFTPPSPSQGWSGSWSEAMHEHKAFTYWGPKQMLAIPLSTYRYDYANRHYEYVSKLQLVKVDFATGLADYASVDHSDFFNSNSAYYWNWRDVRRSIFIGDYVYAISDRGLTAHNVDTMELSASLQLPGDADLPYWWW